MSAIDTTTTTPPLVHPVTGEVTDDPAALTIPQLAKFVADSETFLRLLRDHVTTAKTELDIKLTDLGVKVVQEDWGEVVTHSGRSRKWDENELEGVLADIVDRGVLPAAACVGVIKTERKVSGTAANNLHDALTGEDRAAVAACFDWVQGKPSVTVKWVQS